MKEFESSSPDDSLSFLQESILPSRERETVLIDGTSDSPSLHLPLGREMLSAEFDRIGHDLYVTTDDATHIVSGYFAHPETAALLSDNGLKIPGHAVTALAGPQAAGEYAGPSGGGDPIGTVEKLSGEVEVTRADGSKDTLHQGDPVFQNDVIHTGNNGDLGIKFADGSVFTLGSDARMTLDDLVYDPGTGEGHSSVTVVEGMFKFVSGEISANNPGAMEIHTPVATIGIRGTTGGGVVHGEGHENQFFLEPNADGTVGWFDVITDAGRQSINQPHMMVSVASITQPPPPPQIVAPAVIQQQFNEVIQFAPPVDKYSVRAPEANNDSNQNNQQQQGEAKPDAAASANGEGQPQDEGQPANAEGGQPQGNAAPQGEQPNAQFATDQAQGEQQVANAQDAGEKPLTPFSGDAQFDGQANAPQGDASKEPPAFIPTGVASADVKPGFTATGTDGFVAAPPSATTSAFAPAGADGKQGAATAVLAPLPPPGDAANGPVPAAAGTLPPPPPPAIGTTTPLGAIAPAAGPAAAPGGNHFANVLIDQAANGGAVGPIPGVTPPPSAGALPPPPPPPPTDGTILPPPPTGTTTAPPPGGGGGAAPAPAGTSMNFTLTNYAVSGSYDNFAGGTGNDLFTTLNADFDIGDTLSGGAGIDRLVFSDLANLTAARFTHVSGIDALSLNIAANIITLDNAAIDATDNHRMTIDTNGNTVTLNLGNVDFRNSVYVTGTGPVTVTGRVVADGVSGASITGGAAADFVEIRGGLNASVSGGTGDDTFFVVGGSGHYINETSDATGKNLYMLQNTSGATVTGGTMGGNFVLDGIANGSISGGGANDYFDLSGVNTGATLNGGAGNDEFDLSGGGTGISVDGGAGEDRYWFDGFSGGMNLTVDRSGSTSDKLFLNSSSGNITVNGSGSGPAQVELNFGQPFSNLSFNQSGNDLVIGGWGGTLTLLSFIGTFSGYRIITPTYDPFGLIHAGAPGGAFVDLENTPYDQNSYTSLAAQNTTVGTNFIGSRFGDNITASAASVYLKGYDGNDTLDGSGYGNTTLYGGSGDDMLKISNFNASVQGGDGNDIMVINNATSFNIDGGNGFDILDYSGTTGPITVNLGTPSGPGGTFTNIEGVIGTTGGDTFTGGAGSDYFEGGAGADSMNGGAGSDTASYLNSSAAVVINLDTSTHSGGDAAGDMLISIENIVGSQYADNITGTTVAGGNVIYGMGGDDIIDAMSGADSIFGGAGNDQIELGGADGSRDIVYYDDPAASGTSTKDTITGFSASGGFSQIDAIDVSQLVKNAQASHLNVFELMRYGYLNWTTDGTNATVTFDSDGSGGGSSPVTLAQINGVNSLNWLNFNTHNEILQSGSTTVNATGTGSNILIGTASGAVLNGGGADDILYATTFGQQMNGGGGNDVLVVDSTLTPSPASSGDAGWDTLYIINSGAVNLSSYVGNMSSIETIDLTAQGNADLASLSVSDVLSLSSDEHELYIDRTAGDTVNIDTAQWKVSTDPSLQESGYTTYVGGTGGSVAILHVQNV